VQVREPQEAVEWVDLMRRNPNLLSTMNEQIVSNNAQGVYDGCKNAVALAAELARA